MEIHKKLKLQCLLQKQRGNNQPKALVKMTDEENKSHQEKEKENE